MFIIGKFPSGVIVAEPLQRPARRVIRETPATPPPEPVLPVLPAVPEVEPPVPPPVVVAAAPVLPVEPVELVEPDRADDGHPEAIVARQTTPRTANALGMANSCSFAAEHTQDQASLPPRP
jgi:hypothetical protein